MAKCWRKRKSREAWTEAGRAHKVVIRLLQVSRALHAGTAQWSVHARTTSELQAVYITWQRCITVAFPLPLPFHLGPTALAAACARDLHPRMPRFASSAAHSRCPWPLSYSLWLSFLSVSARHYSRLHDAVVLGDGRNLLQGLGLGAGQTVRSLTYHPNHGADWSKQDAGRLVFKRGTPGAQAEVRRQLGLRRWQSVAGGTSTDEGGTQLTRYGRLFLRTRWEAYENPEGSWCARRQWTARVLTANKEGHRRQKHATIGTFTHLSCEL